MSVICRAFIVTSSEFCFVIPSRSRTDRLGQSKKSGEVSRLDTDDSKISTASTL